MAGSKKSTPAETVTTVLQKVVFPPMSALDAAGLYVDTASAVSMVTPPRDPSVRSTSKDVAVSVTETGAPVHLEDFLSRRSLRVRANERLSLGTYFNGFPAGYWRRWTTVEQVTLRVRTSGAGTVVVMKSNARGALQQLDSHRVTGETETSIDLTLESFGDGGWLWFDLVAGEQDLVLEGAEWVAQTAAPLTGRAMIQMTTMNKPDFCIDNLRRLGQDSDVLDHVQQILIVDQGTDKVADQTDFAEVAEQLGGRLRIIDQSNLGGSGGFARGMSEAVTQDFDYVLLLDDDVEVETESLPRMLAMSQLAKTPTIIGGQMFDLYNRSILHTMGEVVNPWRFMWDNAHSMMGYGHDFASLNLRRAPWLHRRVDVDYNGWWMCLIPTSVIREIGAALPVFIKWDDAEYGLRAKEHGFPTVTLPGTAVWHVSWVDKDDTVGWQAYFHARNRIIAALLHSPYDNGGRVPRELFTHDVRHLLSLQYGTVSLRHLAVADVLAGPEGLADLLPSRLGEVRKELGNHSDAQLRPEPEDFPAPGMAKPPRRGKGFSQPPRALLAPWALKNFVRQVVAPVAEEQQQRPQVHLPHQDNSWWRVSQFDSALVSNAEGTGASWYRRDPKKLRTMLAESTRLSRQLGADWEDLSRRYREALPELVGLEAWGRVFDEHTTNDTTY
ncbi:glycosyltransferase [Aeromicrobium sp. Leaf350]|uniref:glycosyltransferase n=1 Tax=Aeromicrobium sp. Leaf350 TaxID=2876565 RepID=UPI001E2C228F|nr:glycosyltransferase [Aeromicrobium sp. Leaf350]